MAGAEGLNTRVGLSKRCMEAMALVGAGLVLLLTVGVGIVAHELSHAVVLHLFGIRCEIDIGVERIGANQLNAAIFGNWATVTPRAISQETASALRLSSVAPLVLATPFLAVLIGIVPDPLQADSLLPTACAIGWLACAIPSPQDFSVFWHAERAVAEHTTGTSES